MQMPASFQARSQNYEEQLFIFVMSVRLSVWNTQLPQDGFLYLSIFRKSVQKLQVWLKSDKNRRISQTKVAEIIETLCVMFSNIFYSEYRAVYEIMWQTMVEADRPQMTI